MAETSSIEWTDATWNPVTGCSVVSPGCTNCYAMKVAGTRLKAHPSRAGLTSASKSGPVWNGQVRLNEGWLMQPLEWSRPRRIFVCAHGDLFHESVPDAWIDRVFAVMAASYRHTFQVLTKRAARMRAYLSDAATAERIWALVENGGAAAMLNQVGGMYRGRDWPLPHVWLGVSAENQAWADVRIPELLATPAALRFLSAEPLLQPLDLEPYLRPVHAWSNRWLNNYPLAYPEHQLDWVIVGGESGPGARPMHPDWAREIRDACAAAGVAFFFKQWGAWATVYDRQREDPDWRRVTEPPARWPNGRWLNLDGGHGFHGDRVVYVAPLGKQATKHRPLDGVVHHAMPAGGA